MRTKLRNMLIKRLRLCLKTHGNGGNMRHFILASHGKLAEGMLDAISIIIGEIENINYYGAYVNSGDDLDESVNLLLSTYSEEDELFVVTDVLGGSVCNSFVRHLDQKNLHILTGMNLGMMLEVLVNREKPLMELIDIAVNAGACGVRYCNKIIEEVNEENQASL